MVMTIKSLLKIATFLALPIITILPGTLSAKGLTFNINKIYYSSNVLGNPKLNNNGQIAFLVNLNDDAGNLKWDINLYDGNKLIYLTDDLTWDGDQHINDFSQITWRDYTG
jgi:hypothetical protein